MAVAIIIAVVVGLAAGALVARRTSGHRTGRWADDLLVRWRMEESDTIAEEALRRSRAVLTGRISEQMAPVHPAFAYDPADARFIGSPIDFVIFDGLAEVRAGRRTTLRSIVLLDVKTGRSSLTTVQRRVRDCVERGEVWWAALPSPGRPNG